MKTSLNILIFTAFLFIVSACSGNKAPEVWGLKLGETRTEVVKSIKARGYDIDPSSTKAVRITADISYREITWNKIECTFDYQEKLEAIVFTTYDEVAQSTIDKLNKYITADGFTSQYDKEAMNERLLHGDSAVIPFDDVFKKDSYVVIVSSDKRLSSHPITTMTYCTTSYYDKKEESSATIQERLERGEEVTVEFNFGDKGIE